MDADLTKTIFPIIGGVLALAGGVFTFVSGRLRDAEGSNAKNRVLQVTTNWIAFVLWLIGCGLTSFSGLQLYAIPFYLIAFALYWKLFLDGPSRSSRWETSLFAVFCATTATMVLTSILAYMTEHLVSNQAEMLKLIKSVIDLNKPPAN